MMCCVMLRINQRVPVDDRYHDVGEIVQNVCDFIDDGNNTAVADMDSECQALLHAHRSERTGAYFFLDSETCRFDV